MKSYYLKSGYVKENRLNIYKSFEIYQNKCLEEYDRLQKEYNFITIDGELPINEIHQKIKDEVKKVLDLGVVG